VIALDAMRIAALLGTAREGVFAGCQPPSMPTTTPAVRIHTGTPHGQLYPAGERAIVCSLYPLIYYAAVTYRTVL